MTAIIYVITAPVWLPIILARWMLQTSAELTLGLVSRLRKLRASWSFVAAVYIFIPLLSMLTARAGGWRPWLVLLLAAQLASVTVVIVMAFQLSPVLALVPKARWLLQLSIRPAEDLIFTEQLRQQRSESSFKTAFAWLDRLDRWRQKLEGTMGRVLSLKTVLLALSVLFLATLGVVICGFAGAYLALWKLEPATFGCITTPPHWREAAFFSLVTITTASGSPLYDCPTAEATKALVAYELLAGIVLVTVLLFVLSGTHAGELQTAQEAWDELIEEIAEKLNYWRRVLEAARDNDVASLQAAAEDLRQRGSVSQEWAAHLAKPT